MSAESERTRPAVTTAVRQPDPVAPSEGAPRSDAGIPPGQQAEAPKTPSGALPERAADDPSRGMVDEGGVHR